MSYENFAACFPTIAEKAGDTLKGAHRSVVETLGRSARVCLMSLGVTNSWECDELERLREWYWSSMRMNMGAGTGETMEIRGERVERMADMMTTQAEFEKILLDHAVIPNLNALEELISTARSRMLAHQASLPAPPPFSSSTSAPISPPNPPPHTLPPATLISAHLSPLLISQNSQLNARLQTVQSQNAGLMNEIRRQRKEIESLLEGIEGKVADLESAGQVLGDEGAQNRSKAAMSAEGVLVAVE